MWTSHSGKSSFMITIYDLYFSYQQCYRLASWLAFWFSKFTSLFKSMLHFFVSYAGIRTTVWPYCHDLLNEKVTNKHTKPPRLVQRRTNYFLIFQAFCISFICQAAFQRLWNFYLTMNSERFWFIWNPNWKHFLSKFTNFSRPWNMQCHPWIWQSGLSWLNTFWDR